MAFGVSGAIVLPSVAPEFSAPALAVPGQPGTPSDPSVVFAEDFDNRPGPIPIARLTDYVGATGQTYTADQVWLRTCNGWIASFNQPTAAPDAAGQIADCSGAQTAWNQVQQLAEVLGRFRGESVGNPNFAVSAYTNGAPPGAGAVEFQTRSNIALPSATGRYLVFSVDAAAMNCHAAHPLLRFELLNAAGATTPLGGTTNPCATGTPIATTPLGVAPSTNAFVDTLTSPSAVLVTSPSVGVRMINDQGASAGNDHAFDNLQILDATPQLDKVFEDATIVLGETTTLTFTVTNTSELSAKPGWSFTDSLPAGMTVAGPATTNCPSSTVTAPFGGTSVAVTGSLANGQASCTVSVDVAPSQTGSFTNGPSNVTQTGLNPPTSTTVTVTPAVPSLSIVKSNDSGVTIAAGQALTYSFLVTNTGNIVLHDLTVNEEAFTGAGSLSAVTCPTTTLAVAASTTCTATYVVQQEDVDAGQIDNTATATGTPPIGASVTSAESSSTAPAIGSPALTIDKRADTAGPVNLGAQVGYTFIVRNTGNVTLTDISVDDPRLASEGIGITCPVTELAPNASTTCVADAATTATEADVLAGGVENTAIANGTPPSGPSVASPPDTVIVPTNAITPRLTIDKTTDATGAVDFGDGIVYSFLVTNTGNVTISDIAVTDDRLTAAGITVTCPVMTLAPNEATTCVAEAPYVVTPEDVEAGSITNTATAGGTPSNGGTVTSPPDTEQTPTDPETPVLSLEKSADASPPLALGQEVVYSFVVTNAGNVTVNDIAIDDDRLGAAGITVTCPVSVLEPTQSTTCVADAPYVATEADLAEGIVINTATADGVTDEGAPVSSPEDSVEIPTQAVVPALAIEKSTDVDGDPVALGDEIVYSFEVTNTGNVTIGDVVVNDDRLTTAGITVTCEESSLAPGASTTCVADEPYVVTEQDVIAGHIENTATTTGTPTGSDTPETSPPDTVDTPTVPATPSLTIDKSADVDGPLALGDEIAYAFEVTNTGNLTITDVVVNDDRLTAAGITVICETTELAPGASTTCVADGPYVVTETDILTGSVENTATAGGTPTTGTPVTSPPDTVDIPTDAATPALTIDKSADAEGAVGLGDQIHYSFDVVNTGNVTLTNVTVNDDRLAEYAITVTCEETTLAPGDATTCVADGPYTVIEGDILAGAVTNTATATGTPPTGDPVTSPEDTVEVPTDPAAGALSIEKSTDGGGGPVSLGDEIVYSFAVTNTGNVSVTNIVVDDDRLAAAGITITCGITLLTPGESTTCVADEPYIVSEEDVVAGSVENTATTTGTPNDSDTPVTSPPDTVDTPTDPAEPALILVKSAELDDANGNGGIDVGEEILYSFAVTNTGNVTATDVAIDDPMLAGLAITVTCDPSTVAPGATIVCVADEPYTVTQADVDAGEVTNIATATGTTAGGPVTTPPSTTTTPGDQAPAIEATKAAALDDVNGNGFADAGETIVFTVTVTNTGNVSLSDIVIDDPMVPVACPADTVLAPGASVDCISDPYTVTDADVAAGEVLNTATVTTRTPGGETPETTTNTTRTPAAPAPAIPGLPRTGAEIGGMALLVAALLALLGGGLMVVAKRRRNEVGAE